MRREVRTHGRDRFAVARGRRRFAEPFESAPRETHDGGVRDGLRAAGDRERVHERQCEFGQRHLHASGFRGERSTPRREIGVEFGEDV